MMTRTRNDGLSTPPCWPALRLRVALLLALLLAPPAMAQDGGTMMRMERLQVDHRDPSSVREALLPLLSGSESIGVIGDWLIVAATDNTRNRIRERLENLDTPIRRLDMTLSFTLAGETGDADGDSVADPETINHEMDLAPGQTVTMDVPATATTQDGDENNEEEVRQISLQVVISNRRIYLDYAFHPADETVNPVNGIREPLQSDTWHALTGGINIRVRPQY